MTEAEHGAQHETQNMKIAITAKRGGDCRQRRLDEEHDERPNGMSRPARRRAGWAWRRWWRDRHGQAFACAVESRHVTAAIHPAAS